MVILLPNPSIPVFPVSVNANSVLPEVQSTIFIFLDFLIHTVRPFQSFYLEEIYKL